MLTKGDDYPLHQTPEPIAYSGTDRNFYDRYFFNGYSPDGEVYFAAALGVYPHLNIMDASFSVVIDGVQHAIHASKVLGMERLDMQVGPLRVEVIEPLEVLRLSVDSAEHGIKVDLLFTRRCLPLEEPRFLFRRGPRTLFDYTRLTQNGFWQGEISVKGKTITVTPEFLGTRDRSWGVRPVGASDSQPVVPAEGPQFYWIWIPVNYETHVSYYHINAQADGTPWNESGVVTELLPEGYHEHAKMASASSKVSFKSGTRRATGVSVEMQDAAGQDYHLQMTCEYEFQQAGIGYTHPEWGHGTFKGELAVGYETYDLGSIDVNEFHHLHVQAISRAKLTSPDGSVKTGRGIVEQLIIGPHEPSGLKDLLDGVP